MDLYHIWCNLKPGVGDLDFAEMLAGYMGHLRSEGLIESYRLSRKKLGLAPKELGEFHIIVETRNLTQLDEAFQQVSRRTDPEEGLHFSVNRLVSNVTFALYRDFPDPQRARGEEKF